MAAFQHQAITSNIEWEEEHRLPDNQRGRSGKDIFGNTWFEEPPFGRNEDGSARQKPIFGEGI